MSEIIELESLLANERNPRYLRDKGFKDLCASIASFPTMLVERPIVVNSGMIALGGNMRMMVLKHLATLNIGQIRKMYYERLSEQQVALNDAIWGFVIESNAVPSKWVKVAEFATEEEEREFIVKDNLQAGEWEMDILSADYDIAELSDWGLEVVWDSEEETGGGSAAAGGSGDKRPIVNEDEETPSYVGEVFIKRGDIIEITTEDNRYRIGCLDSTNETEIGLLMDGAVADMVFQDPSYNVSIKNSIGGHTGTGMENGKEREYKSVICTHDEFDMAAGEMSEEEFTDFLFTIFSINYKFSKDGSIHYQCMDWKHIREIINAGYKAYHNPIYGSFLHCFKNMCVWNNDNGGMGTFYRSKHELVFIFKKCLNQYVKHTNNFMLGQEMNGVAGRFRTNVWDYKGVNSFGNENNENGKGIEDPKTEIAMHTTVKPLQMVVDAMLDCSNRGELVIDLFGGSGTTLCAGLLTKRNVFTNDISPKYAQTALKRAWLQCIEAGTPFTVAINGEPFDNFDAL